MSIRDPDNSQNVLIALVLSMLVLFAWQYFYAGPKLDADKERIAQQAPGQKPADGAKPQPTASAPQGGAPANAVPGAAPPGATAPAGAPAAPPVVAAKVTRQDALGGTARVAIESPSIKGSIPLKGARLDDIVLAMYRETVQPTSPNVVLFSPVGAPEPYFAEFGWVAESGAKIKLPDRDSEWTQEGSGALTQDAPVTLAWNNGAGLTFKRTIAVDQIFLFTVSD